MIFLSPAFGSRQKGKRASHDVRPLFDKLNVDYAVTPLPAGDFWFVGNGPEGALRIGIELKLVPDLISSMQSGRLKEQLSKMLDRDDPNHFDRVYLVVEGPYRASRGSGLLEVPRGRGYKPIFSGGRRPVFWTDVERFLIGLGEAGVRVLKTRTQYETVRVVSAVLQPFWDKPYDSHEGLGGLYQEGGFTLRRESEARHRVRLAAKALSGIGNDRTQAVADAFGSIANMADASLEDWESVPGIGKKIASSAYIEIREDCRCQDENSTSTKRRRTTSGRSSVK